MTVENLDFRNPTKETFQRNGENPITAVIAYTPDCLEPVIDALEQLVAALEIHLGEHQIRHMETYAIKLANSEEIHELDEMSLFFSLSYPTAPGRTYEMQFGAPPSATLH